MGRWLFGERKRVFYICSACIMIAHEEGNKRKKADYKYGEKILRFSPKAIYWSIALHSKTLSNTKNKADLQQMIFAFNILHGLCFCPCCFVSECSTVSTWLSFQRVITLSIDFSCCETFMESGTTDSQSCNPGIASALEEGQTTQSYYGVLL